MVARIVLVGLMGAGQSTVGAALSAGLGWPLHDSDRETEAATGRTVHELAAEVGVDQMHRLESEQLPATPATGEHGIVRAAASVVGAAAVPRGPAGAGRNRGDDRRSARRPGQTAP